MKVSALCALLLTVAAATNSAHAEPAVPTQAALATDLEQVVDSALPTQTHEHDDRRRLKQTDEDQHAFDTRRLTPSAFEDLAARHLSAAAQTDEALEAEAEALFKMYKRLFAEEVAGWGDTSEEQFAHFYKHVFPKIVAKARAENGHFWNLSVRHELVNRFCFIRYDLVRNDHVRNQFVWHGIVWNYFVRDNLVVWHDLSDWHGLVDRGCFLRNDLINWHNIVRNDLIWHDHLGRNAIGRNDIDRNDLIWYDYLVRNYIGRNDLVNWHGIVRNDINRNDIVWNDIIWNALVWHNHIIWNDIIRDDTVWNDIVRNDLVWHDNLVGNDLHVGNNVLWHHFVGDIHFSHRLVDYLVIYHVTYHIFGFDNTNNIETVVASASGGSSTTGASTYTSPTILGGVATTTADGRWRRMLGLSGSDSSGSSTSADVLFCDVTGNAIWKWSAEDIPLVTTTTTGTTTTISIGADDVCSSTTTTLSVSAYQSGCSLQNHPEGCGSVYYKGCGGMTVSPNSDKIVVARTGGRTLGVLSYVSLASGECQGRVKDTITEYNGRKFNSPTYAEFSNKDILYFTDSPFGLATSEADFDSDALDTSSLREIPFNGVYMLRNGSKQSVELVDCDMDRPNKIAFSPSQDKMYITNSRASNSYVKEYTLAEDGSAVSSSVFFNFTAVPELDTHGGYASGIKTDDTGNVYVVVGKSVFIFSANATLVGSVVSNQALDSVALGVGRMFITGGFGVVAQSSGVEPSQAIAQARTTCDAR